MNAQYRPDGSLAISEALLSFHGPMSVRRAAHLLRRAGFGGSPADIALFARLSPAAAVDRLVTFGRFDDAAPAFDDPFLDGTPAGKMRNGELRQTIRDLQIWWLGRMIRSPYPLEEKMTLFWHGHFPSAYGQKRIGPTDVVRQNEIFRRFALGNARDLTYAISRDPAMLKYLDNRANVKAHPNENYARELMELFTLGIGNYTETDVRESARAFTGWTIDRMTGECRENLRAHDNGVKHFLGRAGNFEGTDIVEIIFEQPACARWFARKLLAFFVYDDPEPELVEAVAELIRRSRFEMRPVVATILRSNVFHSERAYRALVKGPVEFVVGTHKLFGVETVADPELAALARMGQSLFVPPSVKGWDGGDAWLSTNTLLTRENFSNGAAGAALAEGTADWLSEFEPGNSGALARRLAGTILQDDIAPSSLARIESYLDGSETATAARLSGENFGERLRGAIYLTMAAPAYQLN